MYTARQRQGCFHFVSQFFLQVLVLLPSFAVARCPLAPLYHENEDNLLEGHSPEAEDAQHSI